MVQFLQGLLVFEKDLEKRLDGVEEVAPASPVRPKKLTKQQPQEVLVFPSDSEASEIKGKLVACSTEVLASLAKVLLSFYYDDEIFNCSGRSLRVAADPLSV